MGRSEYLKFQRGEKLSRAQAVSAQCFECNGFSVEKAHDCRGTSCPLYPWSPWGKSHGLRPVKRPGSIGRGKKDERREGNAPGS